MAKKASALRYARAVFEIALERDQLDRWQSDLERIVEAVRGAEVSALLQNPRVRFENKAEALSRVLEGVNPLALNLAYLLASRGQPGLIGDIAAAYHRLVDERRGIAHARVITAVPLTEGDETGLVKQLREIFGKEVKLETELDPRIMGGLKVRVGGTLLDGSLRSRLMALRKELVGEGKLR
ncbi:MAG: ATP synthase F1 subunit delta [Chloroflexi bacterium]|nr:ATP synthase F1 subunit delta [Chloroflexota bacterium]